VQMRALPRLLYGVGRVNSRLSLEYWKGPTNHGYQSRLQACETPVARDG
jgi:hypothetical protein